MSHDPSFGPYISVMPGVFDSHPLAFAVRQAPSGYLSLVQPLLDLLPSAVAASLGKMKTRFLADWIVVRNHVVS